MVRLQCGDGLPSSKGEAPQATAEARVAEVLASGGRAVGIDLGITHFAADSDGNVAESPQFLETSLAKLRKLQRPLSRKKQASRRRQRARLALAKQHERIRNQRSDFLHKLSRYYVDHYDVICVENLAVSGMLQ